MNRLVRIRPIRQPTILLVASHLSAAWGSLYRKDLGNEEKILKADLELFKFETLKLRGDYRVRWNHHASGQAERAAALQYARIRGVWSPTTLRVSVHFGFIRNFSSCRPQLLPTAASGTTLSSHHYQASGVYSPRQKEHKNYFGICGCENASEQFANPQLPYSVLCSGAPASG